MECTIENAGAYVRVYLSGNLSSITASEFYDHIVGLAAVPSGRVLMNLEALTDITRAGSRAIFVSARLLHANGGRLAICGASPQVRRSLAGCGFDHAFCCFDVEDDAYGYLMGVSQPDDGPSDILQYSRAWTSQRLLAS